MGPTEADHHDSGGLGKVRMQEIATRLREVQRRCRKSAEVRDHREAVVGLIDAVLADLEAGMEGDAGSMDGEDLDLGLATVEEMLRAGGAKGFVRVIASIRSSLSAPADVASLVEEPPPPRRFQPLPTDAVRRRRPKPRAEVSYARAAAAPRKGHSGRLILALVVLGVIGVATVVVLQRSDSQIGVSDPGEPVVIGRPEAVSMPAPDVPTVISKRSESYDDFDYQEEAMARFTLEIRLAEGALADGDVNESLRHFATAAAIDRHHHRVIEMGKSLIAAFLQEADSAYDAGDPELASKKVRSARDLARGLRLDESPIDSTARKIAVMTRFEDISPRDREELRRAVGRPVRLTLKSRDVVFGHLIGVEDEFLNLDVYSGIRGGEAEFSTRILSSTVKKIRVFDARDPSEIVTGD